MIPELINQTSHAIGTFSLPEATSQLKPLAIFVGAIVLYGIFIFKFYRFLARKDIFKLNLQKYAEVPAAGLIKFLRVILYLLQHIIIFPLFTFFWFGVMAVLIVFLSKNYGSGQILLISMSLVGAVRVTAYYNEDLSRDLAKMIPFAMLGVFIVDGSYFSLETSLNNLYDMVFEIKSIIYYLVFVIALEFLLRMLHLIFRKEARTFEPAQEE